MKREELLRLAQSHGFNRVGITRLERPLGIDAYDSYLSKGYHGTMSWMVRSRPPRANPRLLLPSAKTVIVLGVDYFYPRPPDPGGLTGMVSRYAWGRDYHKRLRKRILSLCKDMHQRIHGFEFYYGVDSRPLIERAWAENTGLGFIGKNAMLISPGQSSFFFLAVILCNIDWEPDRPLQRDHCGRCRRCLDLCPTDAFSSPKQLDARRCISYLTIEHKGMIEDSLKEKMGRWFFGCDICQEVCPHNHKPVPSVLEDFKPKNSWIDLEWVLHTSPDVLLNHFNGTPIRRSGSERLKRNAAIVLGNLRDTSARAALNDTYHRESGMVRDAAAWALDRIG